MANKFENQQARSRYSNDSQHFSGLTQQRLISHSHSLQPTGGQVCSDYCSQSEIQAVELPCLRGCSVLGWGKREICRVSSSNKMLDLKLDRPPVLLSQMTTLSHNIEPRGTELQTYLVVHRAESCTWRWMLRITTG